MDKKHKGVILIVDDEPAWRDFSEVALSDDGYQVKTTHALEEALRLLKDDGYDLVFVSSDLLEPEERELLDNLVTRSRYTRLIVTSEPTLSRTRSLAECRTAFKLGAEDCVSKPLGRRPLLELIGDLLDKNANTVQH